MKFGWGAIVVVLVLGGLAPAFGATLRIGVEATHYPPYYTRNGRGEFHGFARELLDRFGKESGHSITYVTLAVPKLLPALISGNIDMKFPANPEWNREGKAKHRVVYSDPVARFTDAVLVLKGKGGDPVQILGTIYGFTPWPLVKTGLLETMTVQNYPSMAGALKDLGAGRIHGIWANETVAKAWLLFPSSSRYEVEGVERHNQLPIGESEYRMASIKKPELISRFNRFMAKNGKELAQLKKRYRIR